MKELPSIPGYRIIKKLGQGGMADVYLGVQENLNREVAIKVLIPSLFRDQQFSTRFIKEAQTAAQLVHPNIITIHDVGRSGDSYYIVMEYLSYSLNQRMKKTGTVPVAEALLIVKMIASALDYAHGSGFIHRDIKPDNIMFRNDGTVVLVDFGIARAMDSSTQLTRTGMSIGTPHYMSPEQCRGEKIDGRSDIYSLGVQFYELLTGKVPYRAENTAGVIIKQIQEPVPTLPPEFHNMQPLLERMMAKKRDERMNSGKEVVQFIDTLLSAEAQQFTAAISHGRQEMEPVEEPTVLTPRPSTAFAASPKKDEKKGGKKALMAAMIFIFIVTAAVGAFLLFRDNNGTANLDPDPAGEEEVLTSPIALKQTETGTETEPKNQGKEEQQDSEQQGTEPKTDPKTQPAAGDGDKQDGVDGTEKQETKTDAPKRTDAEPLVQPKKEKVPSAIDRQLARDKRFNTYLKQARNDLAQGEFDSALKRLAEAKKLKQTPDLALLEKTIRQAREERLKRRKAMEEKGEKLPEDIRTTTILGLKPELIKQYNERLHRVQMQVPGRRKWDVKGAVTLNLTIDEMGGITMKLENENLTITPNKRRRLIMMAVKRRLSLIRLPEPRDKNNQPIRVEGWRVTYKVVKFQNRINLIKQ